MDSPVREIYRDPDVVRADDRVNDVVHTDTARKMLSIFRQMEENACKEDLPDGPKPLKRFTPPPEDKYAKATASDSEEDEDEEGEESDDESTEERDPNYVRASDKVRLHEIYFICCVYKFYVEYYVLEKSFSLLNVPFYSSRWKTNSWNKRRTRPAPRLSVPNSSTGRRPTGKSAIII